MSRYIKKLEEGKTLVYGTDHALGYFYEIWKEEDEFPEVDRSTMFGMPHEEMVSVLKKHDANESHVKSVKMKSVF
jgi:hypothetical protein